MHAWCARQATLLHASSGERRPKQGIALHGLARRVRLSCCWLCNPSCLPWVLQVTSFQADTQLLLERFKSSGPGTAVTDLARGLQLMQVRCLPQRWPLCSAA